MDAEKFFTLFESVCRGLRRGEILLAALDGEDSKVVFEVVVADQVEPIVDIPQPIGINLALDGLLMLCGVSSSMFAPKCRTDVLASRGFIFLARSSATTFTPQIQLPLFTVSLLSMLV